MAIRYDASLNEQLRRTVRNYNAKIKRLERRGYSKEQLPTPTSVDQLKEEYTSRSALKRELKSLSNFNKRGVERITANTAGVEMSLYRIEELKSARKAALLSVSRRLKEAAAHEPVDARFQSDWYKQLQAKQESIRGLNLQTMTSQEIEDHLKDIRSEIDYTMDSENFYQKYFEILGIVGKGTGNSADAEYVKKALMELTPRQLSIAFEEYPSLKAVEEKYKNLKRTAANGFTKEEQMYIDMAEEDGKVQIAGSDTPIEDLMEVVVDSNGQALTKIDENGKKVPLRKVDQLVAQFKDR